MFVRGEFELGRREALTLPQAAVVLREGFTYVFRLEGEGSETATNTATATAAATAKVALTKVGTGRRLGERIEVAGLAPDARVVASGAGFLADGDTVRLVAPETAAAVEAARQEIVAGRHIFSGALYDQSGQLRCRAGEAIPDEVLMRQVDWLVKGVDVLE